MNIRSNPVMLKELRGRMRGRKAVVMLTSYLSVIGVVTMLLYLLVVSTSSSGWNNLDIGPEVGRTIFITVILVALVQVCFLTPSLTAGSIAGEKERQSYDLLVTTLLSPWDILFGKMVAALSFALLLVLSVLPLAGLSFLFGGVSATELVIAMLGLIVTALTYATIGIFWSIVMRTTIGATIMAQGSVLILLLGTPFLFIVIVGLFDSSLFGVDIDDSLFFVGIIVFMIYAHPFMALGVSYSIFTENEDLFLFQFDDVVVLSPWIGYALFSLLISAIFLFMSGRLLNPTSYASRKPKD
ncbi:MAG: ABC transporter permease [Chloroflexaceae bacterium]|nr:ABC transporter permease [Chloroflexaceae bacterium]